MIMRKASHKVPSTRRAGFTLIELMVALLVGSIAISSFYAISRSSTLFFQEQNRVGNLQTRLQQAMAQVKRDLRLAGHMAAPNLATAPAARRCNVVAPPFTAAGITPGGIVRFAQNSPTQAVSGIDPGGQYPADARVSVDTVWLLGNFDTYASYQGLSFNPNIATQAVLNPTFSYSAQRRFSDWQNGAPGTLDPVAFDAAFRVGRPVALTGPSGIRHLAVLTGLASAGFATGAGVTFTFTPAARNASGSCDLNAGWIAPLQAIEYQVLPIAAAAAGGSAAATRNQANLLDPGETLPQLHRREIDLLAGTPMADGEDRVVMDYVTAFQLTFLTDNGTVIPQDRDVINWDGNNLLAGVSPETIRGVRVVLSARSPGHDQNLYPGPASALGSPFDAFVIDPKRRGAAHVRTMRADIFMPNMAVR